MKMGYLVEYSEKKGLSEPLGLRKRITCTGEELVNLLQRCKSFVIWNAIFVDIDEWQLNHRMEDEKK